jgi:serine/threonine-protein phosphatase 2A activator
MLDDISVVKTWDKVNSGMHKMYAAEVLGKLPVMQHFLFGTLLPYTGPPPPAGTAPAGTIALGVSPFGAGHEGHAHPHARTVHPKVTNGLPPPKAGQERQADAWGDCCGIPVPSAFGAADAERRPGAPLSGPTIRPVPFD